MNSVELIDRGWLLLLAFTTTVLVVAALRKSCRHLFGTERAFQLWLLPPLAMLTSQLPHAADTPVTVLPTMVWAVTSAVSTLPARSVVASAVDWHAAVVLIWLAGAGISLGRAAMAQWRYRAHLRDAVEVKGWQLPWPVLRAGGVGVGPALVGGWRSRIVLPADFEQRYDAVEQMLILAHEAAHARRGDGWWSLFARTVAALCWFHPLAWWALGALRHDQELACDAAVLREHGKHRRSYANAMLKTQSAAAALPVGCAWSPRHPLTERIAMLKLSAPNPWRRRSGAFVGFALALVVTGSVYAASAPLEESAGWKVQSKHATWKVQGPEYQLDMQVDLKNDDGHNRHVESAAFALCMKPGKAATASVGAVAVEATTATDRDGRVRIDMAVGNTGGPMLARHTLRGVPGKTLHASGRGADGKQMYAIEVTPQVGCPARLMANASPVKITEHVKDGTARAVAESIAAKAGWTLVNPDALGLTPITLSFNGMPAGTAMQRVAELAGVNWILEDKRVRFTPK